MDIRNSARAILMNNSGQVLLFKFKFEDVKDQKILWVTPGEGLKIMSHLKRHYEERFLKK